jgi:hypothetical protein
MHFQVDDRVDLRPGRIDLGASGRDPIHGKGLRGV